jgi:hypothetical protein
MLLWPFQTTYNTAVQSESLTFTIYPSATRGGTGARGSQHPLGLGGPEAHLAAAAHAYASLTTSFRWQTRQLQPLRSYYKAVAASYLGQKADIMALQHPCFCLCASTCWCVTVSFLAASAGLSLSAGCAVQPASTESVLVAVKLIPIHLLPARSWA